MTPLVIYHANCADGFGAAFAAWKKLGAEAEYVPMQYGEMDLKPGEAFNKTINYHGGHRLHPSNLAGLDVYILDFSFSRETMEHIFANAKRVVWLDHHKTAFEMWCGKYEKGMQRQSVEPPHHINLDDNKSGAMLAWEYFHPGTEVPMLIQHIDDRDRWVWAIENTRAFSEALNSYPYTFDCWDVLLDETSYTTGDGLEGYDRFISEGQAILRATQQRIDKAVNGGLRKVRLLGNSTYGSDYTEGLALNAVNDISEIGNALAKKSGTFGLTFFIKGDEAICSLRSIAPYDVSVIAKHYGGGGHAQAAGFKMPIDKFFITIWV